MTILDDITEIADEAVELSPEHRALLDEWSARIRAIHDEAGRPIESEEDPRYAAVREGWHPDDRLTPAEWGELYFVRSVRDGETLLPRWPLPVPVWVKSIDVLVGQYPEIEVSLEGKPHGEGRQEAHLERLDTIFVDDDPFGPERRGDYRQGTVHVHNGDVDLAPRDALVLARGFGQAVADLDNVRPAVAVPSVESPLVNIAAPKFTEEELAKYRRLLEDALSSPNQEIADDDPVSLVFEVFGLAEYWDESPHMRWVEAQSIYVANPFATECPPWCTLTAEGYRHADDYKAATKNPMTGHSCTLVQDGDILVDRVRDDEETPEGVVSDHYFNLFGAEEAQRVDAAMLRRLAGVASRAADAIDEIEGELRYEITEALDAVTGEPSDYQEITAFEDSGVYLTNEPGFWEVHLYAPTSSDGLARNGKLGLRLEVLEDWLAVATTAMHLAERLNRKGVQA